MGSQPRRRDSCRSTAPTTLSKLLLPIDHDACIERDDNYVDSKRSDRSEFSKPEVVVVVDDGDSNRARDLHDVFNIIALIPIVVLNAMNWDWAELWRLVTMTRSMNTNTNTNTNTIPSTLAGAWTGEWFDLFYSATLVYFGTDLVWVWILPSSVRSPGLICKHHCVALVFLSLVPCYPARGRWCMGAIVSVEVNTWFLIARRLFRHRDALIVSSWRLKSPSLSGSWRKVVVSVGFYAMWFLIRVVAYPLILVHFLDRYWSESQQRGTYVNMDFFLPALQFSLCVLNFKWTFDLMLSAVRQFRQQREAEDAVFRVEKGL